MTIKEIDAELQRLRNLRRELEKQEIAEFQEKAKENVGRCFIVNKRYVKVIDIPREIWSKNGRPDFNPYQYPALFLGYDPGGDPVIPFYYDTLFSGVWGDGHDPLQREIVEITSEEYETKFGELLKRFVDKFIERRSCE